MPKKRQGQITRCTKETDIKIKLCLDGSGQSKIKTGIPFFDHMLTLFTAYAFFDLELAVKGDLEVDYHHTVEDIGICLGQAFLKALESAKGITRFASLMLPMDESLCRVALDISGRPYFEWNETLIATKKAAFDSEAAAVFFRAFTDHGRFTLHLNLERGQNLHHVLEACFKGVGLALGQAVAQDPRRKNQIPSTKGILL